jgi:gamma-glutamyltranspeptidase/glutathione hydrolase
MSPTIVFRDYGRSGGYGPANKALYDGLGNLVLSLGSSGGPKIITLVLQTRLKYAFVGMPLFEYVSTLHIHDQLLYHGSTSLNVGQGPDIVLLSQTCVALERRGHNLI